MRLVTRIAGLCGLAVGLGMGAAMAAIPVTANADPLPPFDPNDFAISIDGMTLFHVGTATANSGIGDFAIADGAGSEASAVGGIFNSAYADGIASVATAATGNFDSATAVDAGSLADAGFGGDFDSATANGINSIAEAASGSNDLASVLGTDSGAFAQFGNGNLAYVVDLGGSSDTAVAGGNSAAVLGSDDIASIFGMGSTAVAGADLSTPGDFDLAAVFGDLLSAMATGGNFLSDILP